MEDPMSTPFFFDKNTAADLVDKLLAGKPIEPPKVGWNHTTLVQLGGAVYAALMARCPALQEQHDKPALLENMEAGADIWRNNIISALHFCGHLSVAACVRPDLVNDGMFAAECKTPLDYDVVLAKPEDKKEPS